MSTLAVPAPTQIGTQTSNTPRPQRTYELPIRRAGLADRIPLQFFFDALLRKDYFLRHGQLAEMLRGRYHQLWIAEVDTILIGVAVTTRGTRLVNVLVHPAYRGLGIGRALVAQSGASEVRVKRNMSSGDPRGFYRTLGFEAAGTVPGKPHIETMRRPALVASQTHPKSKEGKRGQR